jgi:hypothetical protein
MRSLWVCSYLGAKAPVGSILRDFVAGKPAVATNGDITILNGGITAGASEEYLKIDRPIFHDEFTLSFALTWVPYGGFCYVINTGGMVVGFNNGPHVLFYTAGGYYYIDLGGSMSGYMSPLDASNYCEITISWGKNSGFFFYVNGILGGSSTAYIGYDADNTANWGSTNYGLLKSHDSGNRGQGPFFHWAQWDRMLAPGEVARFVLDPYAVLRPTVPAMFGSGWTNTGIPMAYLNRIRGKMKWG